MVIDEVSMLHPHQLDLLDRVARHMLDPLQPFGGLQIILSGDFFQLPPVSRELTADSKQFAFESVIWKTAKFLTCYLSEQHRQGNDLLTNVLNDIRSGKAGEQTKVPLRTRYKKEPAGNVRPAKLFARNINVDKINDEQLNALASDEKIYHIETSGVRALVDSLKRGCPAPTELRLRIGARVMFVKNAGDGSYVNGTLGKVEAFDGEDDWPVIRTFNNHQVIAEPEQWSYEENGVITAKISQVPLKLAWAITVHKSQGMTLDAAEIDLSDAFERGMGYVALSRVRSLTGLKLMGLNEIALQVHPKILSQDSVFQQWSLAAADKIHQCSAEQLRERQLEVLLERFEGKFQPTIKQPDVTINKQVRATQKSEPLATKAYMPWTREDDEKLILLYRQNISLRELAGIFQRGRGAIRSRLKKLEYRTNSNSKDQNGQATPASKSKVTG